MLELLLIIIIIIMIMYQCQVKENFSKDGALQQLHAMDPQDLYLTKDAINYIPEQLLPFYAPYYNLVDEDGWTNWPFYRNYQLDELPLK